MNKLVVLMVFVLLFSITILAGDLSKEEIVNELKKITVVANKDVRLEMYDILAGKLGLKVKVLDESIIKNYSGNGTQTTRPFTVDSAWEMQWYLKDEGFVLFMVGVMDEKGNQVGAGSQSIPGKGSSYIPKGGTYYLSINAVADWEIKIVEVK